MKHQFLLLTLLTLGTQVQADDSTLWSSLWRNADQRADAMMQQGNASGAAQTYTDPRKKAFAQFKAGDYGAAAQELGALNDSEAHYNRGNALAHAGDLHGALKAFDAALTLDPNHQDARHNRDLVAKAQSQDAEKDKPQNSHDKPENSDKQGKPNDPGSSQPASQKTAKTDASDSQNAQGPNKSGAPQASSTQGSDSEQARQAASMKGVQQASSGDSGQDHAGERRDAQTSAPTEKQMAQEQWLRSIPDDPGGLLRRKFMIQHMMRQRESK